MTGTFDHETIENENELSHFAFSLASQYSRQPRNVCHPSAPARRRRKQKGFKDALNALVIMRQPELEHNGKKDMGLRDLVFNHLLVRPELERVREMAWLQAKVLNTPQFTVL